MGIEKRMSLKRKIKTSRFILTCIFFSGYAAYAVYAVYYYRAMQNFFSLLLLCLIAVVVAISIFIMFVSYRINLMDKPRPALLRFVKMTKYAAQLLRSLISIGLVLTAVQNLNVFSLIIAAMSIPFLLWNIFVNVVAEFFERKFAKWFGKKCYVPVSKTDSDGNPIDMTEVIAHVDGASRLKKQQERAQKRASRRKQ